MEFSSHNATLEMAGHSKTQVELDEEEEIDRALEDCLEDIWDNYDEDGNGVLEYKEAKKFIKDVLRESGMGKVSSKDIKKAFNDFDADKSGTMDKAEMKEFLRIMGDL
jgi:Ca2+-binding EF-hand superfamily protein